MKDQTYALETLQIFKENAQQFPMILHCIESNRKVLKADHADEAFDMKVIWAGVQDKSHYRIICQLTALEGGRVNSFFAKVMDKDNREVAREEFVSFETSRAFAHLIIPAEIFHECYVQMEAASVNERRIGATAKKVSLSNLYVGNLNVKYQIGAPVITRKGVDDKIEISYYKSVADKSAYDYVYDGKRTGIDQMYLDSSGVITIKNAVLKKADMILTVSNGSSWQQHPIKPVVCVQGSRIDYQFEREWKDTKLTECLGKSSYAWINYLLEIEVLTADGDMIRLIITNIKQILSNGKADSIYEIPRIHAYLDCFGKGTMISMADGSKKAVEEIKAGELVRSKGDRNVPVKEVRIQGEAQVLGIYLDSGEEILVTEGHAVNTVDGIYPASRLKEGQKIITENGTGIISRIIPQCDRMYTVYALVLEESAQWLYAGGIMTHSSGGEELFQDRDWVREELPKEWLTDYDNALKAGLIYGKRQ